MEFTKNTLSDLDYVSKYLFEEYESMVVKCNVKHTPIPSEIKIGDRIYIEKCSLFKIKIFLLVILVPTTKILSWLTNKFILIVI